MTAKHLQNDGQMFRENNCIMMAKSYVKTIAKYNDSQMLCENDHKMMANRSLKMTTK